MSTAVGIDFTFVAHHTPPLPALGPYPNRCHLVMQNPSCVTFGCKKTDANNLTISNLELARAWLITLPAIH